MSSAASALAETIRSSGVRRSAFLGLAKNVGKTTALVAALAEVHRLGVPAGTTSAGRDGEERDAITGEPKPRFRVWPGQLVASASTTFASATFSSIRIETLPFPTRFGFVELRRAEAPGEIEVIGPSTASQMSETAAALEASGARILLIDGAVGRRAFAGARVSDGVVLSVGMAAGQSLESVLAAARNAVELILLPAVPPGAAVKSYEGAVTDVALRDDPPRSGETLLAEDFTAIFLTAVERRRLAEQRISLAVRRPARLLALTSNPTAPGRPPFSAQRLFEALNREFPEAPLFDLIADLRSGAAV